MNDVDDVQITASQMSQFKLIYPLFREALCSLDTVRFLERNLHGIGCEILVSLHHISLHHISLHHISHV
jgi:hypothetical protein